MIDSILDKKCSEITDTDWNTEVLSKYQNKKIFVTQLFNNNPNLTVKEIIDIKYISLNTIYSNSAIYSRFINQISEDLSLNSFVKSICTYFQNPEGIKTFINHIGIDKNLTLQKILNHLKTLKNTKWCDVVENWEIYKPILPIIYSPFDKFKIY